MATKAERSQRAWHKYDESKDHNPSGLRGALEWAEAEGLIELPDVDPYDILADQMSQALCVEMGTASHGRAIE